MCGIFGCLLEEGAAHGVIHEALERLEYRGYDSAGIATIHKGKLYVKKDQGTIRSIHKKLNLDDLPGSVGIGHTRWATHGAPLQVNAHPHVDCNGKIAVVHNGIIENFAALRRELERKGHKFISRTDTEIIPHLIEEDMASGLNFTSSVKKALKRLEGSYAIAAVCASEHEIICARKGSPLIVGVGKKRLYVSSDIPAMLPLTNQIVEIKNSEFVTLSDKGFEVRKIADWSKVERKSKVIDWSMEIAKKDGFPHFMLKEIHEQPSSIRNAILLQDKYLDLLAAFLDRAREIFLLASGTSYHACLAASYMFNKIACLPTTPVIASEFIQQYGDSVGIDTTVFAVSQSGETADVLNAIDHARFKAATILGLTNVIGSTLTRVARAYICQQSGPEIGVAATKTFTSQLMVLAQLALRLAKLRGKISQDEIDDLHEQLTKIPEILNSMTRKEEKIRNLARKYRDKSCFYFLGRGINTATALEGRLKLLEIARVPAIAYPAGESKHGPISLVEPGFPVVFVAPKDGTRKTILGNITEMKTRGGTIIGIIEEGDKEILGYVDDFIDVPKNVPEILTPIAYILPLQLFAYYMAIEKGLDPDRPVNLAKSVTVL
ncbi:MAG: glutamine--fructose-6-phosphate transaminase (isomerizing) [Candidatus Bathyarchaeota archaeon]